VKENQPLSTDDANTVEHKRLNQARDIHVPWKKWGLT
jgi:hypothetical protein